MDQSELFECTDDLAQLLEHAEATELKDKWPESLAAMLDVAAAVLRREGFEPERAMKLAGKVLYAESIYHGGRHFYLPKNDALDHAIRNRALFHRWMRGEATPEKLAEELGVTYTRIMQILSDQRKLWREKHEPQLPGF